MIHEIGIDLGKELAARACPIPVVDGPERRPTTTHARERIVIEHDITGADEYGPRHRADVNPRTRLTRLAHCKITIYAQEPHKGPIYWEHIRRAEQILDMVLIGLDFVAKKRGNLWSPKSGKFVYPEDLSHEETPGGAVYELFFTFDRGVADRNWDGTAQPTTTITAVYPDTSPTGVIIRNTDTASGSTEDGGQQTETV